MREVAKSWLAKSYFLSLSKYLLKGCSLSKILFSHLICDSSQLRLCLWLKCDIFTKNTPQPTAPLVLLIVICDDGRDDVTMKNLLKITNVEHFRKIRTFINKITLNFDGVGDFAMLNEYF